MGAFLCVVCFVYFCINYMDNPHYENAQDYTVQTTRDEMFFDSQIKLTYAHSGHFFNTTTMKLYLLTPEDLFQRGMTPKYFILEIDYNTSKDSATLTDTIEVPFDKEWGPYPVRNRYGGLCYYEDSFYFLNKCTNTSSNSVNTSLVQFTRSNRTATFFPLPKPVDLPAWNECWRGLIGIWDHTIWLMETLEILQFKPYNYDERYFIAEYSLDTFTLQRRREILFDGWIDLHSLDKDMAWLEISAEEIGGLGYELIVGYSFEVNDLTKIIHDIFPVGAVGVSYGDLGHGRKQINAIAIYNSNIIVCYGFFGWFNYTNYLYSLKFFNLTDYSDFPRFLRLSFTALGTCVGFGTIIYVNIISRLKSKRVEDLTNQESPP